MCGDRFKLTFCTIIRRADRAVDEHLDECGDHERQIAEQCANVHVDKLEHVARNVCPHVRPAACATRTQCINLPTQRGHSFGYLLVGHVQIGVSQCVWRVAQQQQTLDGLHCRLDGC